MSPERNIPPPETPTEAQRHMDAEHSLPTGVDVFNPLTLHRKAHSERRDPFMNPHTHESE